MLVPHTYVFWQKKIVSEYNSIYFEVRLPSCGKWMFTGDMLVLANEQQQGMRLTSARIRWVFRLLFYELRFNFLTVQIFTILANSKFYEKFWALKLIALLLRPTSLSNKYLNWKASFINFGWRLMETLFKLFVIYNYYTMCMRSFWW